DLAGGVDGDRTDTGGAEVESDDEAVHAALLGGREAGARMEQVLAASGRRLAVGIATGREVMP
ncbi:MAG: hypothetical protein ACK47U_05300, partial [Verrucomicrobiota bacterium]